MATQKLLRAEVEGVAVDLGVGFDFEIDALLGHEDVRGIERRQLAIGGVNDATSLDEQEAVAGWPAQSEPVRSGVL